MCLSPPSPYIGLCPALWGWESTKPSERARDRRCTETLWGVHLSAGESDAASVASCCHLMSLLRQNGNEWHGFLGEAPNFLWRWTPQSSRAAPSCNLSQPHSPDTSALNSIWAKMKAAAEEKHMLGRGKRGGNRCEKKDAKGKDKEQWLKTTCKQS